MTDELPGTDGLPQAWPLPADPRPIVLVGAGGIANDAHLPSYRRLGLPLAGVYDADRARAEATRARWDLPRVFESLAQATQIEGAVFDVATPPDAHAAVLAGLPAGAGVLIQKPFGRDLAEATSLLERCREKRLTAAVNFQLRFSPGLLFLRAAIERGLLGKIHEIDVGVHVHTPWELWPFLESLERVEIALHSIHYLDAVRHLVGEPRGALALTLPHPSAPKLASSRSSILLDYGDAIRASVTTNHQHRWGDRFQRSRLTIEGSRGAAVYSMGVNLDYPRGCPDTLELCLDGETWRAVRLRGSWFTEGFEGPMCNLQRVLSGEDEQCVSSVADAWRTMALVEACYEANDRGSIPVRQPDAGPRRPGPG